MLIGLPSIEPLAFTFPCGALGSAVPVTAMSSVSSSFPASLTFTAFRLASTAAAESGPVAFSVKSAWPLGIGKQL